jgi:hypothetical protein
VSRSKTLSQQISTSSSYKREDGRDTAVRKKGLASSSPSSSSFRDQTQRSAQVPKFKAMPAHRGAIHHEFLSSSATLHHQQQSSVKSKSKKVRQPIISPIYKEAPKASQHLKRSRFAPDVHEDLSPKYSPTNFACNFSARQQDGSTCEEPEELDASPELNEEEHYEGHEVDFYDATVTEGFSPDHDELVMDESTNIQEEITGSLSY